MASKGQVPGSIGTKIIILRIAHGPFASNPNEPRLMPIIHLLLLGVFLGFRLQGINFGESILAARIAATKSQGIAK